MGIDDRLRQIQANGPAQPSFEDRVKANRDAMVREGRGGPITPRYHMPAVDQARNYDSHGNRVAPGFDKLGEQNEDDAAAGRISPKGTPESNMKRVMARHFPDGLPSDDAPNSIADRIRAARQTGMGDAPQLSAISQQMMYRPDGSQRPVPSQAMLDKWDDIDRQAGRQRTWGGGAVPVPSSEPQPQAEVAQTAPTGRPRMVQMERPSSELPIGSPERTAAIRAEREKAAQRKPMERATEVAVDAVRTEANDGAREERRRQLTEAGLTPEEADRVEGIERSTHGDVSPQLSAANDTPEAKAERARRIEGGRRTEARQDNFARSQLGGHLTGREALEDRARQEGLRGSPAAKPQGWQPISQEDFTDHAAGYGLSPEEAARAYEERPDVMRGTGNDRVLQAQASRAQEEWMKTMPGVHRKAAQRDMAKYGHDGNMTNEQALARIDRAGAEQRALHPKVSREHQLKLLADKSGLSVDEVRRRMFPAGVPTPKHPPGQSPRQLRDADGMNTWVQRSMEKAGNMGPAIDRLHAVDPAAALALIARLDPDRALWAEGMRNSMAMENAAKHKADAEVTNQNSKNATDIKVAEAQAAGHAKPAYVDPGSRAKQFLADTAGQDMSHEEKRDRLAAHLSTGPHPVDGQMAVNMADKLLTGEAFRNARAGKASVAEQDFIARVIANGGTAMSPDQFADQARQYGLSRKEAHDMHARITGKAPASDVADAPPPSADGLGGGF